MGGSMKAVCRWRERRRLPLKPRSPFRLPIFGIIAMFASRFLLSVTILILCLAISLAYPQGDSSASGSITQPWGGGLGSDWGNPYGGFSNSYNGGYRYSNGLGFL